jgi:hypothetical protein
MNLDLRKRGLEYFEFVSACRNELGLDRPAFSLSKSMSDSFDGYDCACCDIIQNPLAPTGTKIKAVNLHNRSMRRETALFKATGDRGSIFISRDDLRHPHFQRIPETVNYSFARKCLERCRDHEICHSSQFQLAGIEATRPTYLIDVVTERLVPTTKDGKYVALSYV